MAHLYVCDQCGYSQPSSLSFEVVQYVDEEDDTGTQVTVELHLCSAQCLSNYAMGLTLDFENDGA